MSPKKENIAANLKAKAQKDLGTTKRALEKVKIIAPERAHLKTVAEDFLSMAHSVEVRSPFLDYRLVEFAATIPGHMKIRNGVVKDILKRAVEPLIPEGIVRRPKEGFVLPIFDWMVDKLKDYSTDVLSESRIGKHDLLNGETVRRLIEGYYSGNSSAAVKVWNLMMFQIWWEKYFD